GHALIIGPRRRSARSRHLTALELGAAWDAAGRQLPELANPDAPVRNIRIIICRIGVLRCDPDSSIVGGIDRRRSRLPIVVVDTARIVWMTARPLEIGRFPGVKQDT